MKVYSMHKSKLAIVKVIVLAVVLSVVPILNISQVHAAPITGRSVVLSNSASGASGISYALSTATLPTTDIAVKSLQVQFCTSLTGVCIAPTGFSSIDSTLASQPTGLGSATGWTVSATLVNSLRIFNASNATNPSGAVIITWNGVANPTTTNTTFYGIITTYSDSVWTTTLDSGSVAISTSTQPQLALTVGETLIFCTGTSITGQNCETAVGSVVDLGAGSSIATSSATSTITASTNGNTGYSVTVNGSTLASGSNTITPLASGTTSSVGTRQFGLNLAGANTVPTVGSVVSGTGTGTAAVNYATNNNFRFGNGEVVASTSGPSNANTYTISYIANIDSLIPAGVYTTTLTYVATANF
jgi:hypothetical protein